MFDAMKVSVSKKSQQLSANEQYMEAIYKQMYENQLEGTQMYTERTWWPEMKNVRERLGLFKSHTCSGDLDGTIHGIRQMEKELTKKKLNSTEEETTTGLLGLGVNSAYELQAA